ncbi:TetR/AcrR family transcriptional regulator [Kerstersia sp.]|uniref:TetR/AcrR family transcriptional regulator n=1 Tax=Kerstersia sp. TaxID=1930783 RepID=UPI003F91251B
MTRVSAARGRPPTLTLARIAQAGIEMTLPRLTFTGVAAQLGVSHVALYKYVANREALRQAVADAIFNQWQIPEPCAQHSATLADYLTAFSLSLRRLVDEHPGLSIYLTRRHQKTPAMLARIHAHHAQISRAYQIPAETTGWLLSTVAYHCIALADTVYSPHTPMAATANEKNAGLTDPMEQEFAQSMQALIIGALSMSANSTA